jgi:nicotinamidase-related amidase
MVLKMFTFCMLQAYRTLSSPSSQPSGGFGVSLGNDVSVLQRAVAPCQRVLEAARQHQLLVIHTREGHRKDLSNLHPYKLQRPGAPNSSRVIGKDGPKGKILIRGEPGHDIVPELYPREGEPIIDKPGKGSFYATDLDCILKVNGITTLLVCGVTTEVCVHTTIREGKVEEIRVFAV